MDYSKKITTELIEKILSKGVRDMPQNPAAQGFTERQIRSFYFLPEQDILFLLSDIDTELVLISGRFNSQNAEINRIERLTEVAQETADKNHSEIENIHSKIGTLRANAFVIVDSLPDPTADCLGKIYLVLSNACADNNYYDEYIVVNTGSYKWEKIGNTSIGENIDLSGYVKNTDYATDTKPGIINGGFAANCAAYVNTSIGYGPAAMYTIFINSANESNIRARKGAKYGNGVGVIAPDNMDLALKIALTESTITLTEEEKASACGWLGALEYVDKTTTKILNSVGLWVGEPVTFAEQVVEAYKLRQTANGLNGLIDGALTKVTKIQGNTVACRNLLNIDSEKFGPNINTTVTYNLGALSVGGTGTITFVNLNSDGLTVQPNTDYTFSCSFSQNGVSPAILVSIRNNNTGNTSNGGELAQVFNSVSNSGKLSVSFNSGSNTKIYIYFYTNLTGTALNTSCFFREIQLEEGTTATEYQPYFIGLKNSYFSGITSTNKNWFNPNLLLVPNGWTETDGVYSGQMASIHAVYKDTMGGLLKINTSGQVTVSFVGKNETLNQKTFGIGFAYTDGTGTSDASRVWIESNQFEEYSITSVAGKTVDLIYVSFFNGDMIYLKDFCVKLGTNDTYIPYEESSLYLDSNDLTIKEELGEWDYIDVEKRIKVKATKKITFTGSTDGSEPADEHQRWTGPYDNDYGVYFTYPKANFNQIPAGGLKTSINNIFPNRSADKGGPCFYNDIYGSLIVFPNADKNNPIITTLAEWYQYLAELNTAGNPLTVAYKKQDFALTAFTERILQENKYTAWVDGTETVMQGDTDNSDVGANPTITNTYAVEYGG